VSNAEKTFQALKDKFNFIKAAGGIVEHNRKHLFIKRLDKWDLPKGKIDAREKTKKAALREIEEECNVKNHTISYKICNTYHTYPLKGKYVLKKTSWYHFTVLDLTNQELKPQTEEDITELRWFSWTELDEVRSNTYQSILDVLEEFAANQK
jgi:ADP-ribose pyrophosphatase YjhB (NUDIX family)